MKFSIGYQLPDELDSISEIVHDYKDNIAEVYFAWPGERSGRTPIGIEQMNRLPEFVETMRKELREIRDLGVKLVLLMNANCYGKDAISVSFQKHIHELVGSLRDELGVEAVTTTSPFVATQIREFDPNIELRASVNMRIGTVKGMEYQKDLFDGFYMQREYNRDFDTIRTLKAWCEKNGKKLHLLANSGCLNFCSNQSFHDNMVAHETEIFSNDNVKTKYPSPCWDFIKKKENWAVILQNSWIRPEDIKNYESYFDTAKLATRMHANPRKVVAAYVRGRFVGNLPDLLEPGHGCLFNGFILDNQKFPADWFEKTTSCKKQCHECHYCESVLRQILTPVRALEDMYQQ